jgi:hypothetical protein
LGHPLRSHVAWESPLCWSLFPFEADLLSRSIARDSEHPGSNPHPAYPKKHRVSPTPRSTPSKPPAAQRLNGIFDRGRAHEQQEDANANAHRRLWVNHTQLVSVIESAVLLPFLVFRPRPSHSRVHPCPYRVQAVHPPHPTLNRTPTAPAKLRHYRSTTSSVMHEQRAPQT